MILVRRMYSGHVASATDSVSIAECTSLKERLQKKRMKCEAETNRSQAQDQGLCLQLESRQGVQSVIRARTTLRGNDYEEAEKCLRAQISI